jgi:hypothetical protein
MNLLAPLAPTHCKYVLKPIALENSQQYLGPPAVPPTARPSTKASESLLSSDPIKISTLTSIVRLPSDGKILGNPESMSAGGMPTNDEKPAKRKK